MLDSLSTLQSQMGEIRDKLSMKSPQKYAADEAQGADGYDADSTSGYARHSERSKIFYPPPPSRHKSPEEMQHDESSRSALHENIEAAMRNDHALLDGTDSPLAVFETEASAPGANEASEEFRTKSSKKKKSKKAIKHSAFYKSSHRSLKC